jgi:hypothetical protein
MSNANHQNAMLLARFLDNCEWAAKPPSAREVSTVLSRPAVTLADVLGVDPLELPFQTPLNLTGNRAARIGTLRSWMRQLPGYTWLSAQPGVKEAHAAFCRVQRRQAASSPFASDLAEFRFWQCVLEAVRALKNPAKRHPTAKERAAALRSTSKLLDLFDNTTLPSFLASSRTRVFAYQALKELESSLGWNYRATKSDAHVKVFASREAQRWLDAFGCAPPAVIASLAALVSGRSVSAKDIRKIISEGDFDASQRSA